MNMNNCEQLNELCSTGLWNMLIEKDISWPDFRINFNIATCAMIKQKMRKSSFVLLGICKYSVHNMGTICDVGLTS
jgi:hypothetical protein